MPSLNRRKVFHLSLGLKQPGSAAGNAERIERKGDLHGEGCDQ